MSYLLYQSDNLVGVYDDLQKAKDMAQGIINNGWAKNFSVVKYKLNTCLKLTTHIVDEESDTEVIEVIEDDIELNSSEEENINKQRSDIQKKLNLLKMQKEKIEESKNRSSASKREIEIKKLTRLQKLKLVENYKSSSISPS